MEYRPDQQKGTIIFAVLIGISVLLLMGVIWILPLATLNPTILIGVSLFALVLLIFAGYNLYQLRTMAYSLSRNGLELTWGFRKVFIPNKSLTWARPADDFKSVLPLPKLRLPGLILGRGDVQGLETVEYGLTESIKAVLISGNGKVFAISPKNPIEFAAQVAKFQQMGATQNLPPVDETFRQLWSTIWAQKPYRNSLLLSLSLCTLSLILAFVFSALYPSVTWVTLEIVPSSQLFILPILAFGIWLVNLFSGILLLYQNQVEKSMVLWIWIASGVVAGLLIIAMLFML